MLYLFNIQDTFNNLWASFTGLDWYIHMILGAVATILVMLFLKWLGHKLKGLVLALKILLILALLAGIITYFVIK